MNLRRKTWGSMMESSVSFSNAAWNKGGGFAAYMEFGIVL